MPGLRDPALGNWTPANKQGEKRDKKPGEEHEALPHVNNVGPGQQPLRPQGRGVGPEE